MRRNLFLLAFGISILLAYLIDIFFFAYAIDHIPYSTENAEHYQKGGAVSFGFLITDLLASIRWIGRSLHDFHNEIIAAFTVGLFGVTAALVIYTYRLWKAAIDVAERQLRAYVAFSSMQNARNTERKIMPTRAGFISVVMRNFGKTPAYDVEMCGGFMQELPAGSIEQITARMKILPVKQDIFPEKTYTIFFKRKAGEWPMYFCGRLEYESFGKRRKYYLCNRWNRVTEAWEPQESHEHPRE